MSNNISATKLVLACILGMLVMGCSEEEPWKFEYGRFDESVIARANEKGRVVVLTLESRDFYTYEIASGEIVDFSGFFPSLRQVYAMGNGRAYYDDRGVGMMENPCVADDYIEHPEIIGALRGLCVNRDKPLPSFLLPCELSITAEERILHNPIGRIGIKTLTKNEACLQTIRNDSPGQEYAILDRGYYTVSYIDNMVGADVMVFDDYQDYFQAIVACLEAALGTHARVSVDGRIAICDLSEIKEAIRLDFAEGKDPNHWENAYRML